MAVESGKVIAVDADAIWVEVIQQSACSSCKAKSACGQQLVVQKKQDGRRQHIKLLLDNASRIYAIGDSVDISVPDDALTLGALWIYLFPLFLLVVGALAGSRWLQPALSQEPASILGAVLGLGVALLITRQLLNRPYWHRRLQPMLIER